MEVIPGKALAQERQEPSRVDVRTEIRPVEVLRTAPASHTDCCQVADRTKGDNPDTLNMDLGAEYRPASELNQDRALYRGCFRAAMRTDCLVEALSKVAELVVKHLV